MNHWKTTMCGLMGAVAVAWQPYLVAGRMPTTSELTFAGVVAALGYFARDR